MKNQGISLITLIITIIVIIILAAIVIFTGLRTPDSAQFSAFTNDVDTVYTAMIDKFSELKVEHAVAGNYRTNEQIYIQLATGENTHGQYSRMNIDSVVDHGTTATTLATHPDDSTKCQNIVQTNGKSTSLDITLPKVREKQDGWYVTNDGRIFNATGFYYNKNTYFNASYYDEGEQLNTTHKTGETNAGGAIWTRASVICAKMFANDGFNIDKDTIE